MPWFTDSLKPRRIALSTAATLLVLVTVAAGGLLTRERSQVLANVDQAFAALLERAPEARKAGALGKTRRASEHAAGPFERALGKIFPPGAIRTPDVGLAALPIEPLGEGSGLFPAGFGFPGVGGFPGEGGGNNGGPGGGGDSGPGGDGDNGVPKPGVDLPPGGPNTPPVVKPPVVVPPVSVVPEPGTWVMMVFGIGLIGAALRRRALATAQPGTQ